MIRTICCTIALLCVLPGCGDSEPAGNSSSENTSAENSSSSQSVSESETGTVPKKDQRPAAKLPEDLPEDIPIYPDSKPTAAGSSPASFNSAPSTLIHLETTDDIKAVQEYYSTELDNQGWALQDGLPSPSLINGKKGDRKIAIQIHELPTEPPSVDISLFFTRPEAADSKP